MHSSFVTHISWLSIQSSWLSTPRLCDTRCNILVAHSKHIAHRLAPCNLPRTAVHSVLGLFAICLAICHARQCTLPCNLPHTAVHSFLGLLHGCLAHCLAHSLCCLAHCLAHTALQQQYKTATPRCDTSRRGVHSVTISHSHALQQQHTTSLSCYKAAYLYPVMPSCPS